MYFNGFFSMYYILGTVYYAPHATYYILLLGTDDRYNFTVAEGAGSQLYGIEPWVN